MTASENNAQTFDVVRSDFEIIGSRSAGHPPGSGGGANSVEGHDRVCLEPFGAESPPAETEIDIIGDRLKMAKCATGFGGCP